MGEGGIGKGWQVAIVLWTLFCIIWGCGSIGSIQEDEFLLPDSYEIAKGFGVIVMFFIWAVGAGVLGVLGQAFRRR